MAYHISFISSLALVSFLIVFYVFLDHLVRGNKTEISTNFSLLLSAILFWSFGAIFEVSAKSDTALLFWKKFEYVGTAFIGTFWLTLALNITTGVDKIRLFGLTTLILLTPCLTALVAILTNEGHGLFFSRIGIGGIAYGPFFYLGASFFFLYMIVGIFLYLVQFLQQRGWNYRKQSLFMIAGASIPLAIHILFVLQAFEAPYDVTPIAFSLSALAFLLAVSRYGLFNIIPIAHRHMVSSMKDGVIVLDRGGTIVEINPAARAFLGIDGTALIGKSCRDIMDSRLNEKVRRVLGAIDKAPSSQLEVITTMASFSDVTVDLSVSNIQGDRDQTLGKIAVIRDVTDRVHTERQLHELSIRDDLTNLYNQRYFYRLLNREIHRADRQGHPLSLLVLDIDNFKEYNDRFGHIEGNKVLARVGEIIVENIRNGVDTAFRFGGDEFIAVLPEVDITQAAQIAERIRVSFEQCQISKLTLSLGIAEYREQCDIENLFELADQAMYHAKRAGRNRLFIVKASGASRSP